MLKLETRPLILTKPKATLEIEDSLNGKAFGNT
jgi:hypothetical protein